MGEVINSKQMDDLIYEIKILRKENNDQVKHQNDKIEMLLNQLIHSNENIASL